jgi:hypothetical protein
MPKPERRPLQKTLLKEAGVLGELLHPAVAAAVIALRLFPGWVMPAGGGPRLAVPIVPLRIPSRPVLDRYGGCGRPVPIQHYLILISN